MDIKNSFTKIADFFKRKFYWFTIYSPFYYSNQSYKPTNSDYPASYETCHLVYACVKKIGEAVANVQPILYEVKGKYGEEEVNEVTEHEILDLLYKPNKFMTKFDLLKGISIDLDLFGNSYLLKVRDKNGKVVELWPLRPDMVEIVPDEKELIKGYKYNDREFSFDDVIHFKEHNPRSSFYGLPPIKPAIEIVKNIVFAIRWNMNFFYNSARPDFLIFTKSKMSKDEKDEFRRLWEANFGGVEKAHKIGILTGEDTKIEKLTEGAKEMEFNLLIQTATDQILTAFGVPRAIIGMVGMNRAEAEAQIYTFLSQTVEPRYKIINEKLNEFLVPDFGDEYYLDYEDPTPENRESILAEYENGLKNNWLLINEVRMKEGLPPVKGGWDFYLPLNLLPAGGLEEKKGNKFLVIKGLTEEEYKKYQNEKLKKRILAGKRKLKKKLKNLKVKEELVKTLVDYYAEKKKREKAEKTKLLTEEAKMAFWKEHDALLSKWEKKFKQTVVSLLKEQRKRVIKALKVGKHLTAITKQDEFDLIDWDKENELFFKVSLPEFTAIVDERGRRIARLIGTEFEMTPNIQKFIDEKALTFAKVVNETTRATIREALKEGIANGEGIRELTARINDIYKDRETWEAERIARTEVLWASNGADLEVYKESGVVEKKEWLAQPDCCAECDALDGEVVDLDENFSSGDDTPPLHPSCRCTLIPRLEK